MIIVPILEHCLAEEEAMKECCLALIDSVLRGVLTETGSLAVHE
jgi:hypothetical protein